MRWFSGLVDFNFKVKYSPGESSQDYDYILWNPEKAFWIGGLWF